MGKLRCNVCLDIFEDNGSHPVICLNPDCIKEAYDRGWWLLKREELEKKVKYITVKKIEVKV